MASQLADHTLKLSLEGKPKQLYPAIEPYYKTHLQVSDTHLVYYEISGNPDGLPVCFVHGGPGAGTEDTHRRFFDPNVYKIILFDQRGCGKSQPSANLDDNTTWSLVADMEAIRKATQVSKWVLFGGSWGSTLALVYAQEYPERVAGLILRGIFLLRKQELDWLYGRNGAAMLYPEAFQSYLGGLPEHKRNEQCLMTTYYEILASDKDTAERNHAAKAWSRWELALSCFPRTHEDADGVLQPMEEFEEVYSDLENLIFARIEAHFFVHGGFLKEDGELLSEERMAKVRDIKTCIVQGRWDMVCPRKSAYDLKQMLSESAELIIVENAGHSTFEPGIEQALLEASDRFGEELRDVV